tara:strand:- start:187 stop:822 length:636 start_codon:yes stop_codon:yes gene_type:complete
VTLTALRPMIGKFTSGGGVATAWRLRRGVFVTCAHALSWQGPSSGLDVKLSLGDGVVVDAKASSHQKFSGLGRSDRSVIDPFDIAVLLAPGNQTRAAFGIAAAPPVKGGSLLIAGFPRQGGLKAIAPKNGLHGADGVALLYHEREPRPSLRKLAVGMSGSAVLDDAGQAIAVHLAGGSTASVTNPPSSPSRATLAAGLLLRAELAKWLGQF